MPIAANSCQADAYGPMPCTLTVTPGQTLIVGCEMYVRTCNTPTDTDGNTYILLGSNTALTMKDHVWWVQSLAGSATHALTVSIAPNINGQNMTISLATYTGVGTAADVAAVTGLATMTGTGPYTYTCPAISTVTAGALVVSMMGIHNTGTQYVTCDLSGQFAKRTQSQTTGTNYPSGCLADVLSAAAGTYTPVFIWSALHDGNTMCVTVALQPGAPPPSAHTRHTTGGMD